MIPQDGSQLIKGDPSGSFWNFPDGTVDKNLPANAGHMGSIPGLSRPHMLAST